MNKKKQQLWISSNSYCFVVVSVGQSFKCWFSAKISISFSESYSSL